MPQSASTAELIAGQIARIRNALPTSLGSEEIRQALAEDIRARAFFSARMSHAAVVSTAKRVVDQLAAGEIDKASARLAIHEVLRAVGYTPEGGFPDDPAGMVPPAVAGSLRDLSSLRRLNFILDTQLALVRGRGQQMRGMDSARLRQFPAWELIRVQTRMAPRAWGGMHDGSLPIRGKAVDTRPRWTIAGGSPVAGGRLIALKGDPIWGELGSSGNFDDALDVDYPPFAFNSGMRWREVSRGECDALNITGPNGETIDEWLGKPHPVLIGTQSGLPAPQGSVRDMDPSIRRAMERTAGITIVEDTATTPDHADEVRAALAKRKAEREQRMRERLATSIRDRQMEYERRRP